MKSATVGGLQQWGIPDWRDEDSYPPAWADIGIFCWEFCRRSPKYRDYWRQHPSESPNPADRGWRWDHEPNGKRGFTIFGTSFFSSMMEFGDASACIQVTLDSRKPINGELARVKKLLIAARQSRGEKQGRIPREILPRYLRVLDADEAKESLAAMASTIFPKKPDAYDGGYPGRKGLLANLKKAKEIRDGGWRHLSLSTLKKMTA